MGNIPKFIWIHASIVELEKHKAIDTKKIGKYLNNYDKIIAICNEMSEEIKSLYPLLTNKLNVLVFQLIIIV